MATGSLLGRWSLSRAGELAALRAGTAATVSPGGRGPLPPGGELLVLVVSELATNGLKYGTPPLVVSLYATDGGWLVDVRDGNSDQPPVLRGPVPEGGGGHGLRIIDRASTAWGWYRDARDATHKHVWAHVPAAPGTATA